MRHVVLAYADSDEAAADRLAAAFVARGFSVEKAGAAKAKNGATGDLVLVWSRHAVSMPGLRRSALAAKADGRLAIARLDGAAPPPSLRTQRTVSLRSRAVAERDLDRLFPLPVPVANDHVAPPTVAPAEEVRADIRFGLGARLAVFAATLAAFAVLFAAMGGPF